MLGNSYIDPGQDLRRQTAEELPSDTNAVRYQRSKWVLGLAQAALSFAAMLGVVLSGVSMRLEELAKAMAVNPYCSFLLFVFLLAGVHAAVAAPLALWKDLLLERRYGLSTQSLGQWMVEQAKGTALGATVGIPALLLFYYLFRRLPTNWWALYAAAMTLVSVVLVVVAPRVILPLFYRLEPIRDQGLRQRIAPLASAVSIEVETVVRFDLGKRSRKANAALLGMGRTRRIVVSDTLLEHFTPAEIESVVAHELGHYRHRHLAKMLAAGAVQMSVGLCLSAWCFDQALRAGHFPSGSLAPLPLLGLLFALYQLVTAPAMHALSQHFELEADRFALRHESSAGAFSSALRRLAQMNLADPDPPRLVELFCYSHPSLARRLRLARQEGEPRGRQIHPRAEAISSLGETGRDVD
ncbi:MAG: M48 family metallopeptidase [Candidatus Oleimicrobiaceae bacterium]